MIHNTFHHSLFDQDFLLDQKMFVCFVHASDKNQPCWWSWSEYPPVREAVSAEQVLATAVIIISYYKVRDVREVMVAVFILSRNIFNIWRCGNPASNIILTHYDGDLDVWHIQIPISLLRINFQIHSVASPAGDRNMDRSEGNSWKYFRIIL